MALQMEDVKSFNASQAREVKAHDVRKVVRIGLVSLESITEHVVRHPTVPMSQIHLDVVVHHDIIASGRTLPPV
jgi:hypothetical protein